MPPTNIASLPEEILLLIFEHLESPPPSQLKGRLEPSLALTTNTDTDTDEACTTPLKSLSQVSHLWRRITLPLLFAFSRLSLDVRPRPEWSTCPACGTRPTTAGDDDDNNQEVDDHHQRLFESALEGLNDTTTINAETISRGPAFTRNTLRWASRIHHTLADYLTFVAKNRLVPNVQSFVLLTDQMIEESQLRFPHRMAATSDYRYRAAAEFWHHLFNVVPTLKRVLIVAPPADLACLANCAIDLFGDWAFEDMGFHILGLSLEPATDNGKAGGACQPSTTDLTKLSFVPAEYPGIATSSILKLRPWSHLSLNEGSFLRAYGTYEYFERGPPSLIYSIKDCLSSNRRAWRPRAQNGMDLSALRSFTYTAILPFANHCDFRGLLPYIDELDIKLAPDPTSGILSDKDRVGKAELEDCWSELIDAYRGITRPFRTFEIRADGTPKLKKFICRDVTTAALAEDLDEEFVPLCLPVWAEMKPGVFVRQQAGPPTHFAEIGDL